MKFKSVHDKEKETIFKGSSKKCTQKSLNLIAYVVKPSGEK